MKIVKPFNLLTSAFLTVAVFGLTSCLNDPTPKPSNLPTVNRSGTTVDPDYIGAYPSLAVAPDGRLHASYYAKYDWNQPGGGQLRHAVFQNGVWTHETVDGDPYTPTPTLVDVGKFTSIAVDGNGEIHIAYWDVTNFVLKYATLPADAGQSWQIEPVASMAAVCEDANLKINSGTIYIGYCDGSQILLASKTIGAAVWTTKTVAALSGTDQRAKVSLQFDGSNVLHIAFFDPATKQIKYMFGPAAGPFSPPVTVATLDSNETRMGLTLDASGNPHLVFYDLTLNTLMHAYNLGTGWVAAVIAQVGDVSSGGGTAYLQLSSLMDHQGRLNVSYYQGTGNSFSAPGLKYLVMRSGDWVVDISQSETLDSSGDVGRTSAIAEDANGTIHVIYRDSTNNDLKYTYIQ
jgi:hypothetical protein